MPVLIAGNISKLHHELHYKDIAIRHLENEIFVLEETVEKLQCSSSGPLQKEGKTFSPETRMFVHVAINNHVQTRNVPSLLGKFA